MCDFNERNKKAGAGNNASCMDVAAKKLHILQRVCFTRSTEDLHNHHSNKEGPPRLVSPSSVFTKM